MRNLVLVLIVAIALTATGTFVNGLTTAPYGAHNGEGDGAGWIQEHSGDVFVQHARLDRLDPQADAVLIVAPAVAYTDTEVESLAVFLREGGRALIADEAGAGRHLVDRLDAGVGISRAPIYSTAYRVDPLRPLAQPTGVIGGLPDPVGLPASHAVTGSGEAVLRVHELSWLDLDHDGRPSLGEPQGPFAVARVVATGQGELLVVGVPGLFAHTLAGLDDAEGQAARAALLDWLVGGERRLVMHEAHRGSADPFTLASLLSEQAGWTLAVAAFLVMFFLVVVVFGLRLHRSRPPRRRRDPPEAADPVLRAALDELPDR